MQDRLGSDKLNSRVVFPALIMALWQAGGEVRAVAHHKYLTVGKLSQNFFVKNFCPKNAKFGLKTSHLKKVGSKIKISIASIIFCVGNF